MKVAANKTYGPADKVVKITEMARPEINDDHVLVKVYATSVSTGQWRMVEMNAGGVLQIVARLIFGVFRPRNPVQGGAFAGRVVAVGAEVTRFKMGDEVFGIAASGAHAEYLALGEDKGIVKKPVNVSYEAAVALPFGGLSALVFLRDFAKVVPGQRVLVTGASGGVGVFGVQLAKAMGAEVTGVTSTGNVALVRELGADHVIDYRHEDFTQGDARYDVILDTAGVSSFAKVRRVLVPNGQFVPLEFGVPEMLQSMRPDRQGRRVVIGVNGDSAEDLQILADMAGKGTLRSIIDSSYPLSAIGDAYKRVAGRHKVGAVVVTVDMPTQHQIAAE